MIIKKIMLENYRSHKNTCVELSKGINLILGVNGSGKSSILEAIGNVLFGINDRTGKQKGKSFIRYGENSAKVEIEFVANDEREYSIKNIFSLKKSGSSVLKDLYTGKEYKNKEEIDTKLSELCGIKRNYTAVYENIIIAKQNEFINIFKETPAKREEVFNKVFNTELYSGMYSGILKDIEDKYSSEKNKIELEKKIISSDMKDENLYLDEIKELEINEKNILTELEEKNLEQKKLIEKVNSYKLKEKNLETLKKQKLNKKETLKQQKEDLKLEILRTKKTKKSVILIEKNKEDYEKYMLLIGKLEKNKKELENLKIIEENNQKLIKINEKLTWEIENFSNEKEKMLQNISLKENEYLNLNNELGKLLEKEKNLKQLELNLRNGLAEIEKIDDNKLYLDKNLFSLKKSIETNEKILETKKNEKDKIDIKKIKEDIEYRENLRKKIDIISTDGKVKRAKIDALKEAKEKLSKKICPLLSENCENIKNKNTDTYFDEILKIENEEIDDLRKKFANLEKEIEKFKDLDKELSSFENLGEEIKKIEEELKLKKIELERVELDIEKEEHKILSILIKSNFETKKDLVEKLEDTKNEIIMLNLSEKKNRLASINKDIFSIKSELDNSEKKNIENKKELDENNKNIQREITAQIPLIETKISQDEAEQKKLQEAYNTYLQNIDTANTLQEALFSVNKKIKNIFQMKNEIRTLSLEIENLFKDLEKISIEMLEENLQNLNGLISEKNKKIGTIKERLLYLDKELQKVKEEKEKIANLILKLKKIENKLYKTKIIRENIKGMGLKISKFMLDNISLSASSNFNKITGRTERILWTNEVYLENGKEKENKYAVYLVGENKQIAFENLSGGEQVAVAISLRESMTEYFSNSRFIILDEPTNNLDKERKKLLAEYIGEILNSLDQSIIVTHDNTFREMAEKIIEL